MRERDLGYTSTMELIRHLTATRTRVAIGVLGDDGGAEDRGGITMAGLATVHEYGATINHPGGTPYVLVRGRLIFLKKTSPAGIAAIAAGRVTKPHTIVVPERAPIRKTFDAQRERLRAVSARLMARVVAGRLDLPAALGQIGEVGSAQIRRTIQRGVEPPLSPATIERKNSSKPLIDQGLLINAYTYQVREGD